MYADPHLNLFLDVIRFASFFLCIAFNVILLLLIFKGHHNELGTYRFLLLAFVLADILYGTVHFLCLPVPEIYKNAYVMGAHGWWTDRTAQSVWPIVYSLSFPLLSYNFIYRLVAVKYPFSIGIFTKPIVIVIMILLTVTNAATWSGITRAFWFANKQSVDYARDFFISHQYPTYLTHEIADIENYVIIIYWNRDFLNGFNRQGIIGSAVLGSMMLFAYTVMICTSYIILHHMKKEPHLSDHSVRLNMQLFRALVLQAITPMFTAYGPIALCCFFPLIGLSIPVFSVLCPPFCALHPVLDSCIMLATVSQFRKTLIAFFLCRHRRASRVAALSCEMKERNDCDGLRRKLSDVYVAATDNFGPAVFNASQFRNISQSGFVNPDTHQTESPL